MYSSINEHQCASLPLWKATAFVLLPSLVAFVTLDGVWIGLVAKNFYFDRLGPGLKDDVDMLAAALSWVCIVAANQVFVLPRTRGSRSFSHIFLQGALMGVVLYGTCDFTNAALLKHWPWAVALLDLAWGTLASGLLALVQHRLDGYISRS